MSRRSRSRKRSRSPTKRKFGAIGVVLAILFIEGLTGFGTAAFRTATVDRGTSVAVADDQSGVSGLDIAPAVYLNQTGPLVNITNRFDRPVTVKVTLQSNSTSKGSLLVNGLSSGDSVTFTLAANETTTVQMSIRGNRSLIGQSVYFNVQVTGSGLTVSAPGRTVPIS